MLVEAFQLVYRSASTFVLPFYWAINICELVTLLCVVSSLAKGVINETTASSLLLASAGVDGNILSCR